MVQAFLVIAVIAIAVLVGQSYPMLGALIAMFPTKIFAYSLAMSPDRAAEGVWGLLIGSLASVGCTATMWFSIRFGVPIALAAGLLAWALLALIGRLAW
jgi:hypothetical protein